MSFLWLLWLVRFQRIVFPVEPAANCITKAKLLKTNYVLGKSFQTSRQKTSSVHAWHLTAPFGGLSCIVFDFIFVFYMMSLVVLFRKKTASPLKAFTCLYAWKILIIKSITSFVQMLRKGE